MTVVQEIQNILSLIEPFDRDEKEHLEFTRKWIASGASLFRIVKPAIPDPHLVSYFLLIDSLEKQLLLVDHKKAGLWLPSGGHVELNEHPKETVAREIIEELKTQAEFALEHPFFLTVTKTVGETAGHTDVTFWYLLKGSINQNYCFDREEFHQIGWFSPKDIPYERTEPHMRRCIKKLQSLNQL